MKLTQIPLGELASYVGVLTAEQAQRLQGQTFQTDSYFNPIQDINDIWVLSPEEIAYCSNPTFLWVKELEMTTYEPKLTPPLYGGEA
jgi:hypothetical protein